MKLQDVFDLLSAGELSQVNLGTDTQGEITASNALRVASNVQLGLSQLFKRFNLRELRVEVPLEFGQTRYTIEDPDLIKIEKVTTLEGFELPLNNLNNMYSCMTPALRVLDVPQFIVDQSNDLPEELLTEKLIVIGRGNHPKLSASAVAANPASVELLLPDTHLTALLYFVAGRVHTPTGMDGNFNPGNNYFAKYEDECRRLEHEGLQAPVVAEEPRLRRSGFV